MWSRADIIDYIYEKIVSLVVPGLKIITLGVIAGPRFSGSLFGDVVLGCNGGGVRGGHLHDASKRSSLNPAIIFEKDGSF